MAFKRFWIGFQRCVVRRPARDHAWLACALVALAASGCSSDDAKHSSATTRLAADSAGAGGVGTADALGTGGVSDSSAGAGGMSEPGASAGGSEPPSAMHSHALPSAGTMSMAAMSDAGDLAMAGAMAAAGMHSAGTAGTAGAAGSAGAAMIGHQHMPVDPDPAATGGMGGTAAGGGAGSAGGGLAAASGSGGMAGAGGSVGVAGTAGMPATMADHCVDGQVADPGDMFISSKPNYWVASNGDIDLVLPSAVLDWMGQRIWEPSHDAWHNIRRCSGSIIPGASSALCQHTELVPASQECSGPDDGYQFLVMHRHMIHALKQSFPQHADLFEGFAHFPYAASDVPEEWRDRFGSGWSQAILNTANVLEDIENRLSQFPSEGSLGQYIQCGGMGNFTSIHGALHFKWVVNESPYSLGKQTVNIDNYMFWKLHGWIDDIWERYRVAKGQQPDEPKLQAALTEQCHQMHELGMVVGPRGAPPSQDPLPVERGLFHETVRPIFEQICSGCHSEASPSAGMSLGGHISSADVVKNLVNAQTMDGGQYVRVAPGSPDQSWLYLKVSGMAMSAGCMGTACNPQTMPPTGQVTLTADQLEAIRFWIAQGAPAPEETL